MKNIADPKESVRVSVANLTPLSPKSSQRAIQIGTHSLLLLGAHILYASPSLYFFGGAQREWNCLLL